MWEVKKKSIVLKLLCIIAIVSGCSRQSRQEENCFAADKVTLVKTVKLENNNYFLYKVVTGFNEKETFVMLYDQKVSFTDCGMSDVLPVFDSHLDESESFPSNVYIGSDGARVEYVAPKAINNKAIEGITFVFDGEQGSEQDLGEE